MVKRAFIVALFIIEVLGCATTNLPTVGELQSLQLQEDERRLWNRSEEEEKRLNHSSYIYEDPVLTAYVNDIAQKLVPEDVKEKGLSFEVKVIKNPLLNAFAYPNGVIYVHTGILSKMENEAQLATLLGHEMVHVTHRHTIENYRSVKNTTAILATVQMAAIPFGVYGGLANLLGSVGAMAAVTGYSRELETEADRGGLEYMVKAGYEPHEAPRLFELLKKEVEEQKMKEPFFFGNHPRLQERIDNLTQFIKEDKSITQGRRNTDQFMAQICSLLLENARLDLAMGRFSSAQNGIGRFLLKEPQNASGHYYLGELYRQRDEKEDRDRALKEYNLAVGYDPSYPEPHKALGLIYYKQGFMEKSGEELERYLFLAPDAGDRGYIEQFIEKINTK
jgi:beta-barrel assembly-enhancing protease